MQLCAYSLTPRLVLIALNTHWNNGNVCLSIPAWEGIKKTEGNPGHALFPAYFFSTSAALGASLRGDLSHLSARLARGKFGAAVFQSKQRARRPFFFPRQVHPKNAAQGAPTASPAAPGGGSRGCPGARRGCVLPPAGCGGTAGRAPRGWRRDAPGGKAAFWSYLEAKQCWFIISIIILKKKKLDRASAIMF